LSTDREAVPRAVPCATQLNNRLSGSQLGFKIKDVRLLRILLIVSALGLMLFMFGWWACVDLYLAHVQGKYSREFMPGMKRQVIEDRLMSEGIRFFPESPALDFVSAGYEVRYWVVICATREVGLMLEFGVHAGRSSGADVLRTVTPVREERGCS
jgi:hypothetical protein